MRFVENKKNIENRQLYPVRAGVCICVNCPFVEGINRLLSTVISQRKTATFSSLEIVLLKEFSWQTNMIFFTFRVSHQVSFHVIHSACHCDHFSLFLVERKGYFVLLCLTHQ